MTHPSRFAAVLAVAVACAGFTTAAQAYFVRPYVQLGEGVVDGYVADGPTERQANFTSALRSEVSLDDGTIRNYLAVTGPGAFGQTAGVMGDRLSVVDADGTSLDFRFDFDGTIDAPARDPALNSRLQIGVFASMYVFASGSGATYRDFDSRTDALLARSSFLDFSDPSSPITDRLVEESLAGSFIVTGAGRQSYDVFYSLSVFASPNDNPGTVTMDFLNTGRAAVYTAPGVVFTSESGVFPGSEVALPVPEPQTYLLTMLGLAAVAGAARRRRR